MKTSFKALALMPCIALAMASCTVYSERDRLQQQNDSLLVAHAQLESEINNYFETLNDISDNLDRVKQLEGIISQTPAEGVEQDPSVSINNSINTISQIISDNNQKIADLSKRYKNSRFKISQLEKSITTLTSENQRLTAQVNGMVEQLAERDQVIASQSLSLAALNDSAHALSSRMRTAEKIISTQDETLNTAWYVFGTTRELKAQGIIAKYGAVNKSLLKGEFNQDYFVKIDIREVLEIPLYSKRAKMLTTHPNDSYILEKLDGQYTLRITNPTEFWSVSRYLVIDID